MDGFYNRMFYRTFCNFGCFDNVRALFMAVFFTFRRLCLNHTTRPYFGVPCIIVIDKALTECCQTVSELPTISLYPHMAIAGI